MAADKSEEKMDWTRFVTRIYVRGREADVYDFWTTEAGLTRWFLATVAFRPAGGAARAGDETAPVDDDFTWTWHGSEFALEGRVLNAEPPSRFEFRFGTAGDVTVTLKQDGQWVLVEVAQSNIPDTPEGRSWYVDCYGGWTFYLANLRSILEGGVDLRELDLKRQEVVNQ